MKTVHSLPRHGLAVLGLLLLASAAWAETTPPCPCPAPAAAAASAVRAETTPPCPCTAPAAASAATAPAPPPAAGPPLPSFSRSERYTAQRKPRITVLAFDDTNHTALEEKYKASVEAMLVTFLKRKSQFVVVERQKLGDIEREWKLAREGKTNLSPLDPSARELFEKIDAIAVGSVTLINAPSTIEKVTNSSKARVANRSRRSDPFGLGALEEENPDAGTRIEIDVKALGRADGRIIAAAQSSGPVACLRSIVERLGVALEQAFLRPYYGRLQLKMSTPENVRLLLTPILLDAALDEEKPPVERGESVLIEAERDIVEPWTTNPTAYTIENLLSGWYTARLERPGYDEIGIRNGNEDWLARQLGDRVQILYQSASKPGTSPLALAQVPFEQRRFVVYVHPRDIQEFDADKLGLSFAGLKEVGSLEPLVRRQLLDKGFTHTPTKVILIGKDGIRLNRLERPHEYAEDLTCDLFEERLPKRNSYGTTQVAPGEPFDAETFQGGKLIFEDYRGEKVPAGDYQIAFWEPFYKLQTGVAVVSKGGEARPAVATLVRQTAPLDVETTGPRSPHHMVLTGESTSFRAEVPLSFDLRSYPSLPVDHYVATTDIPGLRGWRGKVDLMPTDATPPFYDAELDEQLERQAAEAKQRQRKAQETGEEEDDEEKLEADYDGQWDDEKEATEKPTEPSLPIRFAVQDGATGTEVEAKTLRIKTRLCAGGRLEALGSPVALDSEDVCIDPEIASLLDSAFLPERGQEPKRRWWVLKKRKPGPQTVEAKEAASGSTETVAKKDEVEARIESRTGGTQTANLGQRMDLGLSLSSQGAHVRPNLNVAANSGLALLSARSRFSRTSVTGSQAGGDSELPPLSRNEARALLAERLDLIDLLILDDRDMERLREDPEMAAIVARHVGNGGSLFAFVSKPGDYREVLGMPLALKNAGRRTKKFQLARGEVSEVQLVVDKKKVKVGGKRKLLRPEPGLTGWRTVAFTTPGNEPRILERSGDEKSGYLAVWFDQPSLFRTRFLHERVPAIEENRGKVEKHVVDRTRALLASRFGTAAQPPRQAGAQAPVEQPRVQAPTEPQQAAAAQAKSGQQTSQATSAPQERLRQLDDLLRQGLLTRPEYDKLRAQVLGSL